MTPRRLPAARRAHERGSVTAETAVALPALVVVLALAMWAVGAVNAQLRCVDAARLAARAVARGDTTGAAVTRAREAAPAGARVTINRDGDLVTVVVHARHALSAGWAGGLGVLVEGRATADAEGAAGALESGGGLVTGGEGP